MVNNTSDLYGILVPNKQWYFLFDESDVEFSATLYPAEVILVL